MSAIAPDAVPTDLVLTDAHRALLERSAVDVDVFLETGGRSVHAAADLPAALQFMGRGQVPGMLFVHQRPDGTRVPQYRPDDVVRTNPEAKYLQAPGTGAIVSLHPRMRGRIGTSGQLVVVEGTKQALAAVSHAASDVLVVGLQGCANYSEDGVPLGELDDLLSGIGDVVIAYDADVKTNRNVYDAGSRLAAHVHTVTPGATVRFVALPAGAKAGLDDYLGARKPEIRAAVLAQLLSDAKPLPRQAPARKKTSSRPDKSPVVDWGAGTIRCAPVALDGGVTTPGTQLADFAARIVASRQVVDDLNANPDRGGTLGVEHDLQVAWGQSGGEDREEFTIRGVPDGQLRSPETWLARIPRALGTHRVYDNTTAGERLIAQAVRGADRENVKTTTALVRTGLWTGESGELYVHAAGAIGANGETGEALAVLDDPYWLIRYPDPAAFTPEQVRDDVCAALEPVNATRGDPDERGLLVDPTSWFLFEGAHLYTLTGAPTKTVVGLAGLAGSGKTTIVGVSLSRSNPALVERALVSAHGTGTSLREVGVGLHQAFLVVDDLLKDGESAEVRAAQIAELNVLGRRGYGGGSQGRDRMRVNRTGVGRSVQREGADASWPGLAIVCEVAPRGFELRSLAERLLVDVVEHDTTMRDKPATERMQEIGRSGAMNRSTAAYIQWLMQQVDEAGGRRPWLAQMEARRSAVEKLLDAEKPGLVLPRQREIPAPIIVGWSLWLDFALAVKAIDQDEADRLTDLCFEKIADLAERYVAAEFESGASPAEQLLDRIRAAVADERATFDKRNLGATLIGRLDYSPDSGPYVDGAPYVALSPAAAANVLRPTTDKEVRSALRSAAVGTYPVRIAEGAPAVRCLLIPAATWDPSVMEVDR